MLASRGRPTGASAAPKSSEPTPDELRMPEDFLATSAASRVLSAVFQTQEQRVTITALFESRFEELVTAGQAAAFPELVERFRLLYDAIAANLVACAERLDALGQPALAAMVQSLWGDEEVRGKLWLDMQLARQHHSVSSIDDPARPELVETLRVAKRELAQKVESITEKLEELRCEATDLEEED